MGSDETRPARRGHLASGAAAAGRAAALALLAAAGCGAVKIVPLGPDAAASPRPPDCAVEFLARTPERAHVELAELTTHLTVIPAGGPLEVLREPACRLGADAVVVTRKLVTNEMGHVLVSGVAIRWRVDQTPPEPSSQ
ncbi:MAG TPA: hypothetical protein VLS93_04495 [Anaeromyxobacteraceae bacterium]|nr:hypothetical protein [Anaeromyxobacteraceae bacterium]